MYTASTPFARILTQSNQFKRNPLAPTKKAFIPTKDKKELSVFDIFNLSSNQVMELAEKHVRSVKVTNIYGYTYLSAHDFESESLQIDYDNTPKRHANIISWPNEKSLKMQIQVNLAQKAASSNSTYLEEPHSH